MPFTINNLDLTATRKRKAEAQEGPKWLKKWRQEEELEEMRTAPDMPEEEAIEITPDCMQASRTDIIPPITNGEEEESEEEDDDPIMSMLQEMVEEIEDHKQQLPTDERHYMELFELNNRMPMYEDVDSSEDEDTDEE